MPVYNVRDYILESIESILQQTYKNVELIIVDDNSSDGTFELITEHYSMFSNIKIFKNDVNSKIVASLNRALTIAQGDYIARMDGDDIAMVDRIEKQMDYLLKYPDVDLVGCSLKSIDENGNLLSGTVIYPENFKVLKKMSHYCSPVSHVWLAKKSVYDNLDGYRFPSVEDYDFLLRMLTSGFKFSNVPNYFGMKIRIRSGNTASSYGLKQRMAFNFVRARYLERLKFGAEKIEPNNFNNYISSSFFEGLHTISNSFVKKGLRTDFTSLRYIMFVLAICISPYQLQYALRRLITKALIRFYK